MKDGIDGRHIQAPKQGPETMPSHYTDKRCALDGRRHATAHISGSNRHRYTEVRIREGGTDEIMGRVLVEG